MLIYRKDSSPLQSIKRIQRILHDNRIKYYEKPRKRVLGDLYSVRLNLSPNYGVNGKGITLDLARASAYGELLERLQTNMLYKFRYKLDLPIDKGNIYIEYLLKNASQEYKDLFLRLEDKYFVVDDFVELKSGKTIKLPEKLINAFCHTNGLASGNSYNEAVVQAIFEILERYSYKQLLNGIFECSTIINYENHISEDIKRILKKLQNEGFNICLKDCSLGRYPVVGLLLFDQNFEHYRFTIGADTSFNIALSRCLTEMFQGIGLKFLKQNMLKKVDLNELNKRFKNNYLSYNWLKSFNNNLGYLTYNFFDKSEKSIDVLHFDLSNDFNDNDKVLVYLINLIEDKIYIKNYNYLNFDTVRVFIPNMSIVDNYDFNDLLITKDFERFKYVYSNILLCKKEDLNDFLDVLLIICKDIKYDHLILPCTVFNLESLSDYYKLNFTSLTIIIALLLKRYDDLIDLLNFQIQNFDLSNDKKIFYKSLINFLQNGEEKTIYHKFINKIVKNTFNYIKSLQPTASKNRNEIFNKLFSIQ